MTFLRRENPQLRMAAAFVHFTAIYLELTMY